MTENNEEVDSEKEVSPPIQWSNFLFLPFNPRWQFLILLVVIVKCTSGPISSVYLIDCDETLHNTVLYVMRMLHTYVCDAIYIIDTFLYIIHRQVTEEALKREFLPKSAFSLLLDLIAVVPFFRLVGHDLCPPVQLWPNILTYSEVVITYRVFNYFSLMATHSMIKIFVGYSIIIILYVNVITCFFLLLTVQGNPHDWRVEMAEKINVTQDDVILHLAFSAKVLSITIHKLVVRIEGTAYNQYVLMIVLMIFGYLITMFLALPKLFAECVLRIRRICTFHPRVTRIIEETKRRNPNPTAHKSVENFYSLIWKKRHGITSIPDIISELPRYLKVNIKQDLVWPVFYHSPMLRRRTEPFKRWLCEYISLEYKLPGERFYAGLECYSRLYYIKSGIVQLISPEDSVSATLSVTSGTVFGDMSFFVPPADRNTVLVRCLTYCEVYSISRGVILKALHKFPEDRFNVLRLAKERIKHARNLYNCKNNVRGLDRVEDEGLAWMKRRWWEINNSVKNFKKSGKEHKICCLPAEEANYHCVKFMGQLVMGTLVELQRNSMFVRTQFPWILAPYSKFVDVWHRIILAVVYSVLIFLPPFLVSTTTQHELSSWLHYFRYFIDVMYIMDICISLLTSVQRHGSVERRSLITILFERFKNGYFCLDVISTIWLESIVSLAGYPQFYYICQFNRIIKTYMCFFNRYQNTWSRNDAPIDHVVYTIVLTHFWFGYVLGYFIYMIMQFEPSLTVTYFYGVEYDKCIGNKTRDDGEPCTTYDAVLFILAGWLFEMLFPDNLPVTISDVGLASLIVSVFFLMHLYTKSKFISTLYLKHRETVNYYFFVSNLKTHYKHHNIHPSLLKRLDLYLECNWKYYNVMDVLYPNFLSELPYDIYSKLHGELSEKIIGECAIFKGAPGALIKELAHESKFLMIPKTSTLLGVGLHAKNALWIAQGTVECEYDDDEGNTVSKFYEPGSLLTVFSLFLRKSTLRTYTAVTDCEILYISREDFFRIIKHYPFENNLFKTCQEEIIPLADKVYQAFAKKQKQSQRKLRETYYLSRAPVKAKKKIWTRFFDFFRNYRKNPESEFIMLWLSFRVVIVFFSITSFAIQGGSGAMMRPQIRIIENVCVAVSVIDIVLKIFLPYYDERGLIISQVSKCALHYMSRGFLLDLLGTISWEGVLKQTLRGLKENDILLVSLLLKFSHAYLLLGHFNYLADIPTANISIMMVIKWQIVVFVIMLGSCHYFISKCVDFDWDEKYNLVHMFRKNGCWIPSYVQLDDEPTLSQLHHLYAESLSIVQCALLMINLGKFHIVDETIGFSLFFLFLGIVFWYVMGYCETLLILHYRGNTLFQHGVRQLKKFLIAERVNKEVIERAVNHFIYVWIRLVIFITRGVNVKTLMNKRIGAVFRQDLGFFFFKKTFQAADSLLKGGKPFERLLASNTYQMHFLPNEDITREMELSQKVYIVHRGSVAVYKDDEKLSVLTKGSVFGQLQGTKIRPVRVTARSLEHVDVLTLTVKQFQDIIDDNIRENIQKNEQSQYDFLAMSTPWPENPFNTTEYILRDLKMIKLPWMSSPVAAEKNNIYSYWLFWAWLGGPVLSCFLVLLMEALPQTSKGILFWIVILLDIFHIVHLLFEFYTMEVVVEGNRCVKKYTRLKTLVRWTFYFDVVSLFAPFVTLITNIRSFQLTRLLRIHSVYLFQRHFCRHFQTKAASEIVKLFITILLIHTMTCGWIIIACNSREGFPVPLPELHPDMQDIIESKEWVHPNIRKDGCPRTVLQPSSNSSGTLTYVVPADWYADYQIALLYLIIIQTHTNMDAVVPLTMLEVYYKVFITFVLYMLEMWLSSVCISVVYTQYREMYFFDFHVSNLIIYLKHNGLSGTFLDTVMRYTKLLWQRRRGNWLPDITNIAPACLYEDILAALYMHHLNRLPIIKDLPPYFLNQLVAKLKCVVIFPGNVIVEEGDIFPCIYFIHEGEVEKRHVDSKGEKRLVSVLVINEHFGLIPGLFPDVPYKFQYSSRTVVDLVYLNYEDWQDLLNSYPELKRNLYSAAEKLKHKAE